MTKKQLVDLLDKSYQDDDEVFVKYEDDQGFRITGIDDIEDVTQEFESYDYWEVRDTITKEWRKYDCLYHPFCLGYKMEDCRKVGEKHWHETKKCIVAS